MVRALAPCNRFDAPAVRQDPPGFSFGAPSVTDQRSVFRSASIRQVHSGQKNRCNLIRVHVTIRRSARVPKNEKIGATYMCADGDAIAEPERSEKVGAIPVYADPFGAPERSMVGEPEQSKSGNGACAF